MLEVSSPTILPNFIVIEWNVLLILQGNLSNIGRVIGKTNFKKLLRISTSHFAIRLRVVSFEVEEDIEHKSVENSICNFKHHAGQK
jgi:hypothetical protein